MHPRVSPSMLFSSMSYLFFVPWYKQDPINAWSNNCIYRWFRLWLNKFYYKCVKAKRAYNEMFLNYLSIKYFFFHFSITQYFHTMFLKSSILFSKVKRKAVEFRMDCLWGANIAKTNFWNGGIVHCMETIFKLHSMEWL